MAHEIRKSITISFLCLISITYTSCNHSKAQNENIEKEYSEKDNYESKSDTNYLQEFKDSTGVSKGMIPFYEALNNTKLNRPVRIAVFGDSFIEADILVADLREMLQKKYGGCGVGFVSITSATHNFRPTIKHQYKGWHSYAYTDKTVSKTEKQQKLGISGYYFEDSGFSSVKLEGVSKYSAFLDTCDNVNFYVKNNTPISLSIKVNQEERKQIDLSGSNKLQTKTVTGRIKSVEFQVLKANPTDIFYGISMDGASGVTVDNFSMRGSTGLFLCMVPFSFLKEFNNVRPYDLIILQYGLNILSEKTKNYNNYENKMVMAIQRLQKSFPQSGILVISTGDRAIKDKKTGEMKSISTINSLIQSQENIARRTGSAFWNMYEAIGGKGSIIRMVNDNPSLANKDYTHINFKGGKYIAELLYNTIYTGKTEYDRKNTLK